jgi:YD repeat-containing protein
VARRPLPRILSSGTNRLARGRERARTAADSATDVLHPLITVTRGLRLLAVAGRQKWAGTPKDRRGPALFLVAACVLVVALMPYGPLLALITVMATAAWKGRDRPHERTGPDDAEVQRLQSLYEALVPYFSVPEDPSPLFAHGGEWETAFSEYTFDPDGRLTRLLLTYPPYFTDSDPVARGTVEQLLHAKSGRGREYHFAWDQEGNQLEMNVLPALSTSIVAQRFVTVPGETTRPCSAPCPS